MTYTYPLSSSYLLPYTKEDSPSVVIEPTTDCNLRCPGCYRRSGYENKSYMSFEETKCYVDDVMKIRNISQLLISGGEPLMYPELDGLIQYARQKKLKVKINSNGLLLDRKRLVQLKKLGVEGVQVHIDKHQGREKTEEGIAKIREEFCEMFRDVGGIRFGFHGMIHPKDLGDVKDMVRFFQKNSDIVSEINFAVYCPAPKSLDLALGIGPTSPGLVKIKEFYKKACQLVQNEFGFEYGAYLGSTHENDRPGKIYALSFYQNGKLLGSATQEQFKTAHASYYQEHGNYGYGSEMFDTFLNGAGHDPEKVHVQYVRVSFPPLPLGQAMSLCDSCVDPILYNNKLIPMCLLEYVKKGDKMDITIDH